LILLPFFICQPAQRKPKVIDVRAKLNALTCSIAPRRVPLADIAYGRGQPEMADIDGTLARADGLISLWPSGKIFNSRVVKHREERANVPASLLSK
jgi:hypothetical protein